MLSQLSIFHTKHVVAITTFCCNANVIINLFICRHYFFIWYILCYFIMAPKRKCSFNATLRAKYPCFSIVGNNDSKIRCQKCGSVITMASGSFDIEKHLRSDKHQNAIRSSLSNKNISDFCINPTKADLHMSALEGVWAYHTVDENHSFR